MTTPSRPATRRDPDPLTVEDTAQVTEHRLHRSWHHDSLRPSRSERRRNFEIPGNDNVPRPCGAILAALVTGFVAGFLVASLIASSRTEERVVQSPQAAHVSGSGESRLDGNVYAVKVETHKSRGDSTLNARLSGWASWFDYPSGQAAAGPLLRSGDWHGRVVTVCARDCIVVALTDACACGDRHGVATLLDLARADFARLAPLSSGILRVTVTIGAPHLPQTDALP